MTSSAQMRATGITLLDIAGELTYRPNILEAADTVQPGSHASIRDALAAAVSMASASIEEVREVDGFDMAVRNGPFGSVVLALDAHRFFEQMRRLQASSDASTDHESIIAEVSLWDGYVVSLGTNEVNGAHRHDLGTQPRYDPTAHAEMMAVRRAYAALGIHPSRIGTRGVVLVEASSSQNCDGCSAYGDLWAGFGISMFATTGNDVQQAGFRERREAGGADVDHETPLVQFASLTGNDMLTRLWFQGLRDRSKPVLRRFFVEYEQPPYQPCYSEHLAQA